jgi:hypothetical protein
MRETEAVLVPVFVGVNATLTLQLPPGAIGTLQVLFSGVKLKSVLWTPVML